MIKDRIKRILPNKIFHMIRDVLYPEKINVLENRMGSFFNAYYEKSVASPRLQQKVALRNAEFKVFSKHGCDGLLLYIFSKIGAKSHSFVEIGVGDGRECNTANLAINFGWKGLLIDANSDWVEAGKKYLKHMLGGMAENVSIAQCFVTAENINAFLASNGQEGEVDLLSIDIDSNDYWVWRSITAIDPRVVVIEYNSSYGPMRSITMKYDPDFHYQKVYREHPLYFGASLSALEKLGKRKGYILIGCDTNGHDAYFVREDVAQGVFSELSPEEAYYDRPFTRAEIGDVEAQFQRVKHLDFEEIT